MKTLCKRRCEVIRLPWNTNTFINKRFKIIGKSVICCFNTKMWHIFNTILKCKCKMIVLLQPFLKNHKFIKKRKKRNHSTSEHFVSTSIRAWRKTYCIIKSLIKYLISSLQTSNVLVSVFYTVTTRTVYIRIPINKTDKTPS